MKLNFENDSDLIIELAEKAARVYCGVTKNNNDFDDAACDAYVIACEIEFDETKPQESRDAFIVRRIVGKLIDEYRKHHRKRDESADLSEFGGAKEEAEEATPKTDFESFLNEFDKIVNLRVPVNTERLFLSNAERQIILDYIEAKRRSQPSPLLQVAKRHKITQGRASQIMNLFKRRARLLSEIGTPRVIIVNVDDEPKYEQYTLFNWR